MEEEKRIEGAQNNIAAFRVEYGLLYGATTLACQSCSGPTLLLYYSLGPYYGGT